MIHADPSTQQHRCIAWLNHFHQIKQPDEPTTSKNTTDSRKIMSKNSTSEDLDSPLDNAQLAEASEASSKGIASAQVRVLCVNGDINHAIIGYGKDCTNAYDDAEVKARAWCVPKGGTQKITRVKCPLV